jgi:hypothetical protein
MVKKFLFLVVLLAGISATGMSQDAPKYLGGGVNLSTTTGTLQTTTVGGGFVEGNYPLFSIFEVKAKMSVDSGSRFSFAKNTTVNVVPEMRMFIPLNKHVEAFAAGGVDSQMITGNIQNFFNPTATVGLRFAKAYDVSFTRLFDTMNTNTNAGAMSGFRFSGNVFRPIRPNIAVIGGFDYDRQLRQNGLVPGSQFKARIGLALK